MTPQPQMILEACLENAEEACSAHHQGAHRIELCSNLEVGGLTPSRKMILRCLETTTLPMKVLIRPRAGNFVYSEEELLSMEEEIDFCKNHPTSGVVLGVLKKEGKIDLDATHRLSNRAHPLSVTFHKAIDEIPEPLEELEKLSDIENVKSILTSGGAGTALKGVEMLKNMKLHFANRFNLIAAGSITSENLMKLHQLIGFREYHGKKIVANGQASKSLELNHSDETSRPKSSF
ncbi:MAG: copper homeostasis protein CutC [SAR324 cluster bacterium]|nr:copper homeostasis protein CutC [SAR324 cluster bacterium]MDP6246314.1 copper homeostasis protein CutC [SAR324 cluster bacterium]